MRLAQTLHIPVADGVLVSQYDGPAYASLQLVLPAIPLPNLLISQHGKCANKYPDESAAIVAFDIWIGNFDRAGNVKASLLSSNHPSIRALDHSHCLLNKVFSN